TRCVVYVPVSSPFGSPEVLGLAVTTNRCRSGDSSLHVPAPIVRHRHRCNIALEVHADLAETPQICSATPEMSGLVRSMADGDFRLRSAESSSGYLGTSPRAYVPWQWFKVMDLRPLALPQAQGDLDRVNVDPPAARWHHAL